MHALFLAASLLTSDPGSPSSATVEKPHKTLQPVTTSKGYYVGAFGGGGSSNGFDISQKGAAFFPLSDGGPLPVTAKGSAENESLGFVGIHVGREWLRNCSSKWYLTQATEIEGYYESTKKKAALTNSSARPEEHLFKDKFTINMGVALVNWVLVLNQNWTWKVSPYVGVGIGAAMISIHHANSAQVEPLEPGVNHFNSKPHDTDWTFATQGKAGLRFPFFKNLRFFAEYRFLYLTSSDYMFGPTKYSFHVPTNKWDVHFNGICNNMYALGLDVTW